MIKKTQLILFFGLLVVVVVAGVTVVVGWVVASVVIGGVVAGVFGAEFIITSVSKIITIKLIITKT